MSLSIGGGKGKNKSTSQIDKPSQEYQQALMDAARKAGAAGPSPLVGGATDYYNSMMKGGNMGMGAMSGDPNATASLMNPYMTNVIDATDAQWNNADQNSMNEVNARATAAGAFGGSRNGVATGVALGENNRNRMAMKSGLLYGGFNDAMGRANNMAQMGAYGAGANANMGMGGVGSPSQWMAEMMKRYQSPAMGGITQGGGTQFGASVQRG